MQLQLVDNDDVASEAESERNFTRPDISKPSLAPSLNARVLRLRTSPDAAFKSKLAFDLRVCEPDRLSMTTLLNCNMEEIVTEMQGDSIISLSTLLLASEADPDALQSLSTDMITHAHDVSATRSCSLAMSNRLVSIR
jgi:hypothetical protein